MIRVAAKNHAAPFRPALLYYKAKKGYPVNVRADPDSIFVLVYGFPDLKNISGLGYHEAMKYQVDFSFLDRPEILEIAFPVAYQPVYRSANSRSAAADIPVYPVEVAEGITVNCAFWVNDRKNPTVFFYHGNGETAADYHWIVPFYHEIGVNFFVAEFRGYGSSGGMPTISNMADDMHVIFKEFQRTSNEEGFNPGVFLMGRSLGSIPALELAFHYQNEINGLIIEGGTANLSQIWGHLGGGDRLTVREEQTLFLNKTKIKRVRKPTLIIHGENDQIMPVVEGKELYQNSGAEDKRLLIIPGAGHNDLMQVAQELYFSTMSRFIKDNG